MTWRKPENLKELFSYRLNRLANVSSAIAARALQTNYELEPREWRIISMLAVAAPMSIKSLAREVHIDKSQASRDTANLIARGLVLRSADLEDGRGVQLSLTTQGKALYRKVFPKAVERNEKLLAVLNPEEREVLERAIAALTEHALHVLDQSREQDKGKKRGRKQADATEVVG